MYVLYKRFFGSKLTKLYKMTLCQCPCPCQAFCNRIHFDTDYMNLLIYVAVCLQRLFVSPTDLLPTTTKWELMVSIVDTIN